MSPSFVALYFPVSGTAKCIVYCYFTRIILFIIVVYSLKSMCIPSFVSIGCCVSELHGHLCPYRNVWPKAVTELF